MGQAPKVGGDVDAYCTKCRMDLSHRVIAMVKDDVKRVECLTCHGQHNYRRPASVKAAEAEAKARRTLSSSGSSSARKSASSSSARSSSGAAAASKTSERSARAQWEKAIAGQPATAFRAYRISEKFAVGDLVRHSKFGDGFVSMILDPNKVEIVFEEGSRTMAQGAG